ncbi:MAG: carotenoid 1,2-hydratase [Chlorobiaceae bacterium]|nr:carotenoid 1,2-hydratase [Chlorobiaceae bacterium]NTV60181.1 carotenoid 1,2-hydratase [Chlorobiaceae bacterium]
MNITTDTLEEVWHDMKAPGAYEWWYFDAEDRDNGISVVIIWFAGFPFSPYYNDRYDRWKSDTGSAPPLPADYSGFSFQLYEKGRETVNFMREGTSGFFESSRQAIGARFENNSFTFDQSKDEYRIDIDFSFPARQKEVKASFVFKSCRRVVYEKKDGNGSGSQPFHQWLLSVPKAEVAGTIEIREKQGILPRSIPVRAIGYHDHNVGAVPLQEYISRWYWGRAFSRHADIIYYLVFFRDRSLSPLTMLFLHDHEEGKTSVHHTLSIAESSFRRGFFAPQHCRVLDLSCADISLNIRHEQVLDSGPFYLRFTSGITYSRNGTGQERIRGISEYLDPGRLQSRFMRLFTRSRIWRDGECSLMYDAYNNFKRSLDLKKT